MRNILTPGISLLWQSYHSKADAINVQLLSNEKPHGEYHSSNMPALTTWNHNLYIEYFIWAI